LYLLKSAGDAGNKAEQGAKVTVRVLVVDNDEAFATIVKESLEALGDYEVTVVTSGEEALEKVVEGGFRLAIVDMGLADMEAHTLLKALREVRPSLKIMVIPLPDEDVQPEELGVQGIFPKPFFVGELSSLIEQALYPRGRGPARPVAFPAPPEPVEEVPAPPAAPAVPRPLESEKARGILEELLRELKAELVMVGNSEGPLMWVGGDGEKARSLNSWLVEVFKGMSPLSDESDSRQGRLYYQGEEAGIYAVNLEAGFFIAALFPAETPLGLIRYHFKYAAEALLREYKKG